MWAQSHGLFSLQTHLCLLPKNCQANVVCSLLLASIWTSEAGLNESEYAACVQGISFVPVPSRAPEMKEYPEEEVPETSQALYHVSARNLSYPSSTAVRFPVPDEKVPWEVRGLIFIKQEKLERKE